MRGGWGCTYVLSESSKKDAPVRVPFQLQRLPALQAPVVASAHPLKSNLALGGNERGTTYPTDTSTFHVVLSSLLLPELGDQFLEVAVASFLRFSGGPPVRTVVLSE